MAYEDIPGRASDAGPEPEREDREPLDDGQEDNPEVARLRGRLKIILEGTTTRPVKCHGSRSGYVYGCRCGACRRANTEYHQGYRDTLDRMVGRQARP